MLSDITLMKGMEESEGKNSWRLGHVERDKKAHRQSRNMYKWEVDVSILTL